MKINLLLCLRKMVLPAGILVLLWACETTGNLAIDTPDDSDLTGYYLDTARVNISTVYLDSLATSGTGVLLAGRYQDPLLGITSSQAYFQLTPQATSSWSLEDNAVFDSIRLLLPYSGYYYGDTAQALVYQIYRLTQTIEERKLNPNLGPEAPDSYFYNTLSLYNTSNTKAEAQPLSTYTFRPRPRSDSLSIRLPDNLGREWFNLKKAGNSKLSNLDEFLEYFKGLKIETTGTGSIVGFKAADTKIRIYYRQNIDDRVKNLTHDFLLISGSTQYNTIQADFNQSVVRNLVRGRTVASPTTGDMGFLQSGNGLLVKLDFPYLKQMKELLDPNLINRVILEIEPVAGTYNSFVAPPTTLALYEGDRNHVPTNVLNQNFSNLPQLANLRTDHEYHLLSRYQFDITQYIINRIKSNQPTYKSLLLGTPRNAIVQTFNRLAVGGPTHPRNRIKLKIYYSKVQ